jgi:DNA processing protein
LAGSPRNAHLFISLLQAKVGASLVSRLGDVPPDRLLEAPASELASRARMTEKAARSFEDLVEAFDPDEVYRAMARRGISVLTPADAGYPERLREIPDPPPCTRTGRCPTLPPSPSSARAPPARSDVRSANAGCASLAG